MSNDFAPNLLNQPMTRREFRTLFEILGKTDDMYISEESYRQQIGISRSRFFELRKLGRFENGYLPASRGCRKRKIHRHFNMHSGRIEIPGLDCSEPIVPMRKPRKPRKSNVKKATAETGTNEKLSSQTPQEDI